MRLRFLLTNCLLAASTLSGFTQTPCENGFASDFPCNNVDLWARVSVTDLGAEPYNGIWVNDIWGWTDSDTGHEYALVGMANGTSFVDVTDPGNPVVIGVLPEHHSAEGARKQSPMAAVSPQHDFGKSVWRDIKVYANHAFIVADADSGHGMQVFDLTELRNYSGTRTTFKESAHYNGVSYAHNIAINEDTGYAYIVGADDGGSCGAGGLHIVNIQDPKNPVYAGCFDDDGYTHDAQIVVYNGPDAEHQGKEIAFASNEDAVTIVDVSNKAVPNLLASESYSTVGYTHQGWLTPDQRYFIANDELDEYYGRVNRTVSYIWDVQDLDNPILIGEYNAALNTIDHNLYTVDEFVFESNYTSGLRILNSSNIAAGELQEVAFFDTYPANDNVGFDGNWSNYPYFESGNIIASDIQGGLFILKPAYSRMIVINVPNEVTACINQAVEVTAQSSENFSSVQWQINAGNGYSDIEESAVFSKVSTMNLLVNLPDAQLANSRLRIKGINGEGEEIFSQQIVLYVSTKPEEGLMYTNKNGLYSFAPQNPLPGTNYTWTFEAGATSTEENPSYQFTKAGTYTVSLVAENNCGLTETTQDVIVTEEALGIEDKFQQDLTIYPNPSQGVITVISGKQLNRIEELYLYSANGKLIRSYQLNNPYWEYGLNLGQLSKGYYLLRIITDKTAVTRSIIMQ